MSVLLSCLVLTACGAAAQQAEVATAGGASDVDTAAVVDDQAADLSDEDRMRQFASCMREHGVDMPDPEPGGGPVRITGGGPGEQDMDTMRAAMEACRGLMPNGGEPPELSAEDLEKARAMAACMREHGVDMPDPEPGSGGGIRINRGGPGDGPPPIDEATLEAAMQACRHLGPQVDGRAGGPGGGPGLVIRGGSGGASSELSPGTPVDPGGSSGSSSGSGSDGSSGSDGGSNGGQG